MKPTDHFRNDELSVRFFSSEDPLAAGDSGLEEILDIFERNAGELLPNKVNVDAQREVHYSRAAAKKQFARRDRSHSDWVFSLQKDGAVRLFPEKPTGRAGQEAMTSVGGY